MLKRCNLFSRLAVMLLGMAIMVAAAPRTEFCTVMQIQADSYGIMGENTPEAEQRAEFVMKDWWDIVRPDASGLKIEVVSAVTTKEEMLAEAAEMENESLTEGEDMTVVAMGMEETMEILEDEMEPLTTEEVAGRTVTWEESITLSDKELESLQRIVYAEAGHEDIMGQILVANVILNRYTSELFPDTIEGIVTQTHYGSLGLVYQFTPAKPGGRYWTCTPTEETIEAVERALNGEDYSEGALYFAARRYANSNHMSWFDRNLTKLFRHGNHEFYY